MPNSRPESRGACARASAASRARPCDPPPSRLNLPTPHQRTTSPVPSPLSTVRGGTSIGPRLHSGRAGSRPPRRRWPWPSSRPPGCLPCGPGSANTWPASCASPPRALAAELQHAERLGGPGGRGLDADRSRGPPKGLPAKAVVDADRILSRREIGRQCASQAVAIDAVRPKQDRLALLRLQPNAAGQTEMERLAQHAEPAARRRSGAFVALDPPGIGRVEQHDGGVAARSADPASQHAQSPRGRHRELQRATACLQDRYPRPMLRPAAASPAAPWARSSSRAISTVAWPKVAALQQDGFIGTDRIGRPENLRTGRQSRFRPERGQHEEQYTSGPDHRSGSSHLR